MTYEHMKYLNANLGYGAHYGIHQTHFKNIKGPVMAVFL